MSALCKAPMLLTKRWLGLESTAKEASTSSGSSGPKTEGDAKVAKASKVKEEVKKRRKRSEDATKATAKGEEGKQAPADKVQRNRRRPPELTDEMLEKMAKEAPAKKETPDRAKDKVRAKRARQRRRKKARESKVMKDPEVATAYLQAWEASVASKDGNAEPGWRFNKATQAWIIRHAYEPDRVDKTTFQLLLRYIEGLKGQAKERMKEDAGVMVKRRGDPPPNVQEELSRAKKEKKKRKKAEQLNKAVKEPLKSEEVTEEELKMRKLRLKRAKQVLAVLGGEEEEA